MNSAPSHVTALVAGGYPTGMRPQRELTACDRLCADIEAAPAWKHAVESINDYPVENDFRIVDLEVTANPYVAGAPFETRECPLIRLSLTLDFHALDDSAADVQRQLLDRVRTLLDRVERRIKD
jgi:hypothetical protein